MIQILHKTLKEWRDDNNVVLVIIEGEGEKAFCAGGDMRALYDLKGSDVEKYAETFFAEEYRMNILLHRYPKPVIVYMNGYVMGGGVGIAIAGSHRIVNEKTRCVITSYSIHYTKLYDSEHPHYRYFFIAKSSNQVIQRRIDSFCRQVKKSGLYCKLV